MLAGEAPAGRRVVLEPIRLDRIEDAAQPASPGGVLDRSFGDIHRLVSAPPQASAVHPMASAARAGPASSRSLTAEFTRLASSSGLALSSYTPRVARLLAP